MSKENLLHQQDDVRETFRRHFPSGILLPLNTHDIHGYRIRRIMNIKPPENQWDENFAVRHPDESTTYVVAEYGQRMTNGKPTVGSVGFLDVSRRGFIAGQSNMVFVGTGPNFEHIFGEVWWTDTRRFMRRKGIGIRRLELMNAFARIYHDVPLKSDWPTDAERGVWQKLVRQGKAKPFEYDEDEFVFV